MGFENMRPGHARCPNYLLAAVLLLCFLLTCNWWSLSTQNYELLKRMDEIGEQLAICSDEKNSCTSRKNTLETQMREIESRLAEVKLAEVKSSDRIDRQKEEIVTLKKAVEEGKESLTVCKADLESRTKLDDGRIATLATMRIEKDALNKQINDCKLKIKSLEKELNSAKVTSTAKSVKRPAESLVIANITPSSPNPKPGQDVQDLPINNGPINDENHESNYRDVDQALENAANEEFDEDIMVPRKL